MMTQSFPEPKPNQHSRLTLDEAITQYKAKLLTAQGLIYHAVKIYRKDGHKFRVKDVSAFCQRLKIHRSTFYKALLKLEKANVGFRWEPEDGLNLWFEDDVSQQQLSPTGDKCRQLETSVANWRQVSPTGDCESPTGDCKSPTGDNQFPKTAPCMDRSVSSNIHQIFINSLSEGEREIFEKFVREEWKRLKGEDVINMERFLAKEEDFKSWHQRFLNSPAGKVAKKKAIATGYDWRQDARFNGWIWEAFNRGYEWVHENEAEREQRQAFYDWAFEVNAFEGVCL